jgi:hypothetical protein
MSQQTVTQEFEGVSESGERLVVQVWQPLVDMTSNADGGQQRSVVGAIKRLKTRDGRQLQYVSQGVYDMVGPMGFVRVTSDDPNAP